MDCATAGRERLKEHNNHNDPVDRSRSEIRSRSRSETNNDRSLNHRCSRSSQNFNKKEKTNNNDKKGTNNNNNNNNNSSVNNNNSSITKKLKKGIKPPKCIRKTSFFSKERFCFVKLREYVNHSNHPSQLQRQEQQQQDVSSSIPSVLLLWPGLMINDLQKCGYNKNEEQNKEESLLSKINTIRRNNNSNNDTNDDDDDRDDDDDANRRLFQDCTQAALTDSRAGVLLFGSTQNNKVIPYKYDDVYFLNNDSNNDDGSTSSAAKQFAGPTIDDLDVIRIVEENNHINGHQEAIKECTDFFKRYGTGTILQETISSSSQSSSSSKNGTAHCNGGCDGGGGGCGSNNADNNKSSHYATGRNDDNCVSTTNRSLTSPSFQGTAAGNNNGCIVGNNNISTHDGPLSPSTGSSNDVAKNSNITTNNNTSSPTSPTSPTINDHMELFLESLNRSAKSRRRLLINNGDVASDTEEVKEKDNIGNGDGVAKGKAIGDFDNDDTSSSVTADDTKIDSKTNTQLLDTDDSVDDAQNVLETNQSLPTDSLKTTHLPSNKDDNDTDVLVPAMTNNKTDKCVLILRTPISRSRNGSKKMKKKRGNKILGKSWTSYEKGSFLKGITLFWDPTVNGQYEFAKIMHNRKLLMNRTAEEILNYTTYYFEKRATTNIMQNNATNRHSPAVKQTSLLDRHRVKDPDMLEDVQRRAAAYFKDNEYIMNEHEFTDEEHELFSHGITLLGTPRSGLETFGKEIDFYKILPTRTVRQIINHARTFFIVYPRRNKKKRIRTTTFFSAFDASDVADSSNKPKEPQDQNSKSSYWETEQHGPRKRKKPFWQTDNNSNGNTTDTIMTSPLTKALLASRNKVAPPKRPRTKVAKTTKKSGTTSTATIPKCVMKKLTTKSTAAAKTNTAMKTKTKIHKAATTTKTKASLKCIEEKLTLIAQQQGTPVSATKAKVNRKLYKPRANKTTKKNVVDVGIKLQTVDVEIAAVILGVGAVSSTDDIAVDPKSTPTQQLLQDEHHQKRETGTPNIAPTKKVRRETVHDDSWYVTYAVLVDFYKLNGHSNVLRSDPNKKLAGWVKRQRNNRREGKLCQKKIDELDQLNFVWHRTDHVWDAKYNMLIEYQKKYGHCVVSSGTLNRSLLEWVQRQKRNYRSRHELKYSASDDRIEALEKIPGWSWEGRK